MRQVNPTVLKKRNDILLDLFSQGFSVVVIGKSLGITRERVCQIIFKKTGISAKEHRIEAKLEATLKSLKLIKNKCKYCNTEFIPTGENRVYCTMVCRKTYYQKRQRMRDLTFKCFKCKKDYHPHRSSVRAHKTGKLKRSYCSTKCFKGYT